MIPGRVILEAIVGSKAYGLDHAESDTDTIGVYVAPIDTLIGLHPPIERKQTRKPGEADSVFHEVGKFCRMAAKCNPTVLETLWIPDEELVSCEIPGQMLRDIRHHFLAVENIRSAFGGYATDQSRKLMAHPEHPRYAKHGRHCFRLLLQGRQLLERGTMVVRLTPEERDLCFALGSLPPEALDVEFQRERGRLDEAADKSLLPATPDEDIVEMVLKTIRWSLHEKA